MSKNELQIERVSDIPIREVSGLCLHRAADGRFVLAAIGDTTAELAWARLGPEGLDFLPDTRSVRATGCRGRSPAITPYRAPRQGLKGPALGLARVLEDAGFPVARRPWGAPGTEKTCLQVAERLCYSDRAMAFTRDSLRQLLALLREDRAARLEFHDVVVSSELDSLNASLDALAKAQARTELRLEALIEAQVRTEERLERLEATVARLAEAQARTEDAVQRLTAVTAELTGDMLEIRYERKASAYLGPLLRRMRVVPNQELADRLESVLPADELGDALLLDLVVAGAPRIDCPVSEVWLAIEVSSVVDVEDVHRAIRRAGLLRRADLAALPVVAGRAFTQGALAAADRAHVMRLKDGLRENWAAAIATLTAA